MGAEIVGVADGEMAEWAQAVGGPRRDHALGNVIVGRERPLDVTLGEAHVIVDKEHLDVIAVKAYRASGEP